MADVACLGILVADVFGRPIDEWPERGRLSLVKEMGIGLGGCAANTGLSLAKLGVDTAVMGKVGNDGLGRFVIGALQSGGIDTGGVVIDPDAATSGTMIMIDSQGERTFLHFIGANGTVKVDDVDMELAGGSRIFHCAGALVMPGFDGEPMAQVLKAAKARGATTSLDTVWDATGSWMATLGPCLEHTQIFLPSLAEAQEITGRQNPADVTDALLDLGVEVIGLKMGPEGSYVATQDERVSVPAYTIDAVDGTGAGDAYVAGFLSARLDGWDLERTARFANAVGALCTTGLGTTAGVRSREGTLEWLEQREPGAWGDIRG